MVDAAERDGLLLPGGDHRRAHLGKHGRGPRDRRRAARLPVHLRDERQDERREDRATAVVRRGRSSCAQTAVPPEDPRSYYSTAERLVRETPGAFRPDQYSNAANPLAHEGDDRTRDLATNAWSHHALRRRSRHGRDDHRRRARAQGAQRERADHRRRPVGLGLLRRYRPSVSGRRGGARTSGPRRSTGPWSTASSKSPTPIRS
jgi:hypothetical protein